MDNNGPKIAFVAVMLFVTSWTRGTNSESVKMQHATATAEDLSAEVLLASHSVSEGWAKEEVRTIPVIANAAHVLISEVENTSGTVPKEQKMNSLTGRPSGDGVSVTASITKPAIYPKTNFDVRANALRDIVAGKLAAFAIVDLSTGKEIYSEGARKRWPIASLTKLMTAIVATEKMGLTKEVVISQSAVDTIGSTTKLFTAGQIFKVGDLLKALLQISRNDAAVALAESYGMGAFMREMNAKAKEIGMRDTTFTDPVGLNVSNMSTLVDLEKLLVYMYNNAPQILTTTKRKDAYILAGGKKIPLPNENRNEFVGQANFLGGKTGFIDESGGNLVSAFMISRRPILVIVLGSENYTDRFEITTQLLSWLTTHYAITSGN